MNYSIAHEKDLAHLPDFNIDNSYELALFIWNEGNGQTLINERAFCITKSPQCATYVNRYSNQVSALEEIYFFITQMFFLSNQLLVIIRSI